MTVKYETHTYEHYGDNLVRTAAQLLAKLPNGWELKSFNFVGEWGEGAWVAVVQGPTQDLDPVASADQEGNRQ